MPTNLAYPKELNTLGDHLRKARLDRGMSQPDLAKILKVTPDTITGWELNRHEPPVQFAKSIIKFLGYLPFADVSKSLGSRLFLARQVTGLTHRKAAQAIGCDPSSVRVIELDKHTPQKALRKKIEDFIWAALVTKNLAR